MLLQERPRLIIAFHSRLPLGSGGTSDMCLHGLLGDGVPRHCDRGWTGKRERRSDLLSVVPFIVLPR